MGPQDTPLSGNYLTNGHGRPRADVLCLGQDRSMDPLWQQLFASHGRWLRTVLQARLGNSHEVDDVMQELAVVVSRQERLPELVRHQPWLYRVAVRQALLYRRKQGRQRRLVQSYARRSEPEHQEQHDPLRWLLSVERRELVRRALGRLPRRDTEILLLKYTEGWSYRELADRLGVSVGVIESRLHRARARLRAELSGEGMGEDVA